MYASTNSGNFAPQSAYYPPPQQQFQPNAGYNTNGSSNAIPSYAPTGSNSMPQSYGHPQQFGYQQPVQQTEQRLNNQDYANFNQGQNIQQAQHHQLSQQGNAVFNSQQNAQQAPQRQQQQQQQQQPGVQRNQVDKATDPHGWALAEYGSPYATSKDWRASPADLELTGFPQQKLMLRVKQRFARSPGDVWGNPAPSFGRPPQQGWSYSPFQPFSLPASGEQLADGFKPLYPGRILADHDVSAADWSRFLEDISVAGRMSGAQQVISQIAPVTAHLGATGYFVTKAIQKRMKRGKEPVIAETVEMWEQNFFLRRGLDVYVRDTSGRITGMAPGEPLPGSNHAPAVELDQHSHDDSDDDSSDDAAHHELSRKERKKEREERKKQKKKDEKKAKEEKKKNKKKPQFYLVITPHPSMQ